MPKLSVYVPDDLAERLREAKLPVSAICQAALHEALHRADEAGAAMVASDPILPADLPLDQPVVRHFVDAIECAYLAAASRGSERVEPEDLLRGILDEGESLILKTIESIGVSRDELVAALDQRMPRTTPVDVRSVRLSDRGRAIIDDAAAAATEENSPLHLAHVLVALSEDTTNGAAEVMRRCRLDSVALRKAVAAMQQGLLFARVGTAASPSELATSLAAIDQRLSRIEEALDHGGGETRES